MAEISLTSVTVRSSYDSNNGTSTSCTLCSATKKKDLRVFWKVAQKEVIGRTNSFGPAAPLMGPEYQ